MKLYDYWRSSASYRARIGLSLKELPFEHICVHLVKDGGQQHQPEYRAKNPQGFVPCLELDDGHIITQSMAILEYLDETYPDTPFLPKTPRERAHVRSLANMISADIHPLNNTRVIKYLTVELELDDQAKTAWYQHWITEGFNALEKRLGDDPFCYGTTPTLADICLVPQVYNAERFKVDLSPYPKIARVNENCLKLDAFKLSSPANHPDAE